MLCSWWISGGRSKQWSPVDRFYWERVFDRAGKPKSLMFLPSELKKSHFCIIWKMVKSMLLGVFFFS